MCNAGVLFNLRPIRIDTYLQSFYIQGRAQTGLCCPFLSLYPGWLFLPNFSLINFSTAFLAPFIGMLHVWMRVAE